MRPLEAELLALARPGAGAGEAPAPGVAVAPVVAAVDHVLREASRALASDVHVDATPGEWLVRFRIDGVLSLAARLERGLYPTLVARLKVLADLPTYVTDVAQDGRIPRERVGTPADLRLSTVPTIHGEKAVVRLFDPASRLLGLAELGLPPPAVEALERAVLAPRGVVVLAGPAGSGKSTTIHAALVRVLERSRGARSVVGIEDPVERVIPGVTQTQVNAAAGFGFPDALRALLRADPEVIHVGEVRDADTARVAVEAGLTGHLVITTVHSGSCAQAFTRLLELGVEPHVLTSAVSFLMSQRLLRRLCAGCAAPVELEPALRERLGPGARPRSAGGCAACHGTGYAGRVPVEEHGSPTDALRRAVLARSEEAALAGHLAAAGMRPLVEHALDLVAEGTTSRDEVERVLGPLA